MLSIAFQLTQAQTRLLLSTAFNDRDGELWLPTCHHTRDFVTPMNTLIRRGLVSHDPNRNPAHLATPLGTELARAIASECEQVVRLAAGADERTRAYEKIWREANRRGKVGTTTYVRGVMA